MAEMDKKAWVGLVVMSLLVLGAVITLSLWLTPVRTELTPVSEEPAQISEEETITRPGEDLAELAEEVNQDSKEHKETNIERARTPVMWQKLAKSKGWNIHCGFSSAENCSHFLKRLLEVDEVVDTQGGGIAPSFLFYPSRF